MEGIFLIMGIVTILVMLSDPIIMLLSSAPNMLLPTKEAKFEMCFGDFTR